MLEGVLSLKDFNLSNVKIKDEREDEVTIKLTDLKSVIEEYNKLVNRIKELEYFEKIDRRIANLDAGKGKIMTLDEAIKYAEEQAKAEGIEI
ncbi:hypothetical protein [Fusobacterium sp. OBRC1]|jgi:hypothetical protein|uniref:hypothetical protein n=1 Tax=Fusobacterium sp. OBRC1 TaxID=1032505 RepID=UPI00044B55B6|nr:hypothetical protein [Fusobacterium sp. OBRC1]EUB35967.1 hypothetical protein HMPREF1501_0163 [Fusobacterium sp. OBRC1]